MGISKDGAIVFVIESVAFCPIANGSPQEGAAFRISHAGSGFQLIHNVSSATGLISVFSPVLDPELFHSTPQRARIYPQHFGCSV